MEPFLLKICGWLFPASGTVLLPALSLRKEWPPQLFPSFLSAGHKRPLPSVCHKSSVSCCIPQSRNIKISPYLILSYVSPLYATDSFDFRSFLRNINGVSVLSSNN